MEALLRKKGVYVVGGTLRDHLLEREPMDIDIAVHGDPKALARELAEKLQSRVITMGSRVHPLFRVVTHTRIFDISSLQGNTIEEDLRNRDFTVNAIAYETLSARVIDVAHGLQDIQKKQIRQVSKNAFQADPLRLLRAFRIAAQLGFQIEKDTRKTIRQNAHLISESAAERVRSELFHILGAPDTHIWLQAMTDTGVLFHILPEMAAIKDCPQHGHHFHDGLERAIQTVHQMEALITEVQARRPGHRPSLESMDPHRQIRLKLAALLHGMDKPPSPPGAIAGHPGPNGRATGSAARVAAIGERFRFSRNEISHAVQVVQNYRYPMHLFPAWRKKRLTRRHIVRFFFKTQGVTTDVLLLALAGNRAGQPSSHSVNTEFEQFVNELIRQHDLEFIPSLAAPALISGHDLIRELNLSPSPLFKQILSRTREDQLAGKITTRKEALNLATNLLTARTLHA